MMFTLLHFVKAAWTFFARTEPRHSADEAYLALATDVYDLERRIRALDDRGRGQDEGILFGLYTR